MFQHLVSLFLLCTLTTLAVTNPVNNSYQQPLRREQVPASAPQVTIQNGTILGSSTNNVDTFRGIPFAKPPLGQLRLRLPQPFDSSFGQLNATSLPRACPQQFSWDVTKTVPGFQAAVANSTELQSVVAGLESALNENFTSEDCLTLNIQRSSDTKSSSKLPVLFWMYGGGWEVGSTQSFDATTLLQKAQSLGHEFIFVAANYRLGAFGFLPGRELQAEGNTNLGLHDQRLALRWIQENIGAFGGDPEKVTLWGQSAGSISTFIHILANDGNTEGLFRAGIMESGLAYNMLPVDSDAAQTIFDQVTDYCNCSTAADKLSCLRSVPYEVLEAANRAQPNVLGYQSIALTFAPRPDRKSSLYQRDPYESLRRGLFARVAVIAGDEEDEGTLFSLARGLDSLNTTDQVVSYFTSIWPTAARSTVARFVKTYRSDPAAGAPFHTGTANQLYGAYKRVAAIIGDWSFILARRTSLHYLSRHNPAVYSYIQTFYDKLPALGTLHTSDVSVEFNGAGFPQIQDAVATYYTSFIHYLDPNELVDRLNSSYGRRRWPQWTNRRPVLLEFAANQSSLRPDTFRNESYTVFFESAEELQLA